MMFRLSEVESLNFERLRIKADRILQICYLICHRKQFGDNWNKMLGVIVKEKISLVCIR